MKKIITLLAFFTTSSLLIAQVTLSTYPTTIANNGQAGIVFQLETNVPIILTGIDCALNTSGTPTWSLLYRPGGVSGPPNVSAAGGWISLGSGSSSVTTAGVPAPVPVPLSLTLSPGSYGFFVGSSVTIGYKTWTSASTDVFTDGIVTLRTGTNFGYGGPAPSPTFHPRQFVGAVHYIPVSSAPNDAALGDLIEPSNTCEGTYDIKVELENAGTDQMDSVEVNWRWNGVLQPQLFYSTTLDTANGTGRSKDTVTLGTKNIVGGINYDLIAWTTNPNGQTDTNNYNDSIVESLIGLRYPSVNLGPDTIICPNEPIDLDAGIGRDSVLWNFTASKDSVVTVGTAGQYITSVWELGCETIDTINVTLFPQPPDVDFGPDTIICEGVTLLLDATTPGMTYLWQNSSTTPTQSVTTDGRYWVILEDANTCNSGDTINVDVFDDPSVILTVAPSNNICFGVPFTFRAFPRTDGSIAYQWRVNGVAVGPVTTDGTFTGPADFGDTVTVDLITDICSTATYPVPSNEIILSVNPAPKGISGDDLVIENTSGVYAVANVATSTFVWRIKGGTITSDSTKNFVNVTWDGPNPNAELICEETDSRNCVRENVQAITVVSIVGSRENSQSIGLGLAYPNPADNSVTIPLMGTGTWDVDVDLYDITGKHIFSIFSGMVNGNKNITFPVSELKNGLYFYRVTTSDGYEAVRKITVSH